MNKTASRHCYTNSSREDIYLYTLRNNLGTEVMISNYGAIISSFRIIDRNGLENDIVLGFEKMEDYVLPEYLEQYPWFGCAVGRYANRIKNGEFMLDGKKYHLTKNRGNDTLHGGISGFDRKVWKFIDMSAHPNPTLDLGYLSPDGEEGFPGNLNVTIRFTLNDNNELAYEFLASCDQPTPVNLTHHSYFNLNNGIDSINDHEIRIPATNVLTQAENLVANGEIEKIENTVFDFREFKSIGDGLRSIAEYDKSYLLDDAYQFRDHEELPLVAEARNLQSGVQLKVFSTEPVLHFYSGKWIPAVKSKKGNHYGPFSGLCLETHKHPNAVNIPHFPDTILRPGETYWQKTIYQILKA